MAIKKNELTNRQLSTLIREWQRGHGLSVDGIAGPITRASIDDSTNMGFKPIIPMEDHLGYEPVICDGFERGGPGSKRKGKGHIGLDFAYKRVSSGARIHPTHTKHFFCPHGAKILACADGRVREVDYSERNGWYVKIDHGGKWLSVYRHLKRVQPELEGALVEAGHVLGDVGFAPAAKKRGFNHLHFEIWDLSIEGHPNDRELRAVDPEIFL